MNQTQLKQLTEVTPPPPFTSEELGDKVAEFLSRGGKIDEVPSGASAYVEGAVVDYDTSTKGRGTYNPLNAQMKKLEAERRKKAAAWRSSRPIKQSVLDKFNALLVLDPPMKKGEAIAHLGVAKATFKRMIDTHYADDPRAAPYAQMRVDTRAAADAKLLAQMQALIESGDYTSATNMAAKLGVGEKSIRRMQRKYKLTIKRGAAKAPRTGAGDEQ